MNIYFDIENIGLNVDYTDLVDQFLNCCDENEEIQSYAYFNCTVHRKLKASLEALGIICRSTSTVYSSKKIKNLADFIMGFDVIEHSKDMNLKKIVIASGDKHFVELVSRLQKLGIYVIVAARKSTFSAAMKNIADEFIFITPCQEQGLSKKNIIKLIGPNINLQNADDTILFMRSMLDLICCTNLKKEFFSDGLYFSTFFEVIKHFVPDFNLMQHGYKTGLDFFVSASSIMDYCVAYEINDNEKYKHKVFHKSHISPTYEMIPHTPLINVDSREFYLSLVHLPQNFNVDKINKLLDLIALNPELDHIYAYIKFLENIGVIKNIDDSTAILLLRPIRELITDYIRKKLIDRGITVNDCLLNSIVL